MISSSSLSAFSPPVGTAQPAPKPHHAPGMQQARAQLASAQPARAQPSPAQALQAKPGATPQPGQVLPRGSLLDLSV